MVVRYLSDAELYHHGVKGQKWGVRRYQNPDGSLTAAGRKKYYNSDGTPTKAGQKRIYKALKKNGNKRVYDDKTTNMIKDSLSKKTYNEFKKAYKKYIESDEDIRYINEKQYLRDTQKQQNTYKALTQAYDKVGKELLGKYSSRNASKFPHFISAKYAVAYILEEFADAELYD